MNLSIYRTNWKVYRHLSAFVSASSFWLEREKERNSLNEQKLKHRLYESTEALRLFRYFIECKHTAEILHVISLTQLIWILSHLITDL